MLAIAAGGYLAVRAAFAATTTPALVAVKNAEAAVVGSKRQSGGKNPALGRLVGQLLIGRMTGTQPSSTLLGRIRRGELGGLIIFPDNFTSLDQLRSTIAALQKVAAVGGNPALLIATDQEGGTVARLPDGPPGLSARQMGETGTRSSVLAAGRDTGWYLRRFGITVDLAPVLDVPDSSTNFLGSRAFGRHPSVVSTLGTAFAQGLQVAHVAATAKHFPGLGTATANTDVGIVEISTKASTLWWRMRPFREAVKGGVQLVMVSNAAYPALDSSKLPAALSPQIVGGLLRNQIGFTGVIVTDAFSTPAPASYKDAPVRAINAGVDILLYSDSEQSSAAAFVALSRDARKGLLPRATLELAYSRVTILKKWIAGS